MNEPKYIIFMLGVITIFFGVLCLIAVFIYPDLDTRILSFNASFATIDIIIGLALCCISIAMLKGGE